MRSGKLVLQRYSRLVIDCNRPPSNIESIPEISDAITIAGNANLAPPARLQRERSIFEPYATSCRTQMVSPDIRFAFSLHSFTPEMSGQVRPWDLGLLIRHPASRGDRLTELAKAMWPDLSIGANQPYQIEDHRD